MPTVAPEYLDLGVTGLLLIVVFQGLSFLKMLYASRQAPTGFTGTLACQTDPKHFERIKEIHAHTKTVQKNIDTGEFKCAWEGRDEIRDFRESLTRNADATEALAVELRLTRTGHGT